ncbi:hypothetical protein [uncultured Algibacter sp.]|uniref:hypothetical protein n=1 Tax=uncultured Algibacter sp. TaxID=298659 RepID=UPI0030ECF8BB|tara:strand:- start:6924 stop:7142 length:219 start_codon:yes stop_codon:yes gene_type:complete
MLKERKEYNVKLKPYINDVLVFAEKDTNAITKLPFFADGLWNWKKYKDVPRDFLPLEIQKTLNLLSFINVKI